MDAEPSDTTTNVTIDAEGRAVLPFKALRALRPEGEQLTLLDVDIDVASGSVAMRRSMIDEEDWWAYTPEMFEVIQRAKNRPLYRISPAELEALIDAEAPQAAAAALIESKRNERSE